MPERPESELVAMAATATAPTDDKQRLPLAKFDQDEAHIAIVVPLAGAAKAAVRVEVTSECFGPLTTHGLALHVDGYHSYRFKCVGRGRSGKVMTINPLCPKI